MKRIDALWSLALVLVLLLGYGLIANSRQRSARYCASAAWPTLTLSSNAHPKASPLVPAVVSRMKATSAANAICSAPVCISQFHARL